MATIDASTLTVDDLAVMLLAWAEGDYATEAATGLFAVDRYWLGRRDFRAKCVDAVDDGWTRHGVAPLASIDWTKAAAFAQTATCSASERAMLLSACSLAARDTGSLGALTTGLDAANLTLVLQAIAHRAGWHERRVAALVTGTLDTHSPGAGGCGALPGFEELRATAYGLLGDAGDWLRSDWQPGHGPGRDAAGHVARAMAAILRAQQALNDAADAMTRAGENGSTTDELNAAVTR